MFEICFFWWWEKDTIFRLLAKGCDENGYLFSSCIKLTFFRKDCYFSRVHAKTSRVKMIPTDRPIEKIAIFEKKTALFRVSAQKLICSKTIAYLSTHYSFTTSLDIKCWPNLWIPATEEYRKTLTFLRRKGLPFSSLRSLLNRAKRIDNVVSPKH